MYFLISVISLMLLLFYLSIVVYHGFIFLILLSLFIPLFYIINYNWLINNSNMVT